MPKRTTSRMKCQNYRGGTFPRRHVERAATAGGGTYRDGFPSRRKTENGEKWALPPPTEAAGCRYD